MVEHINNFYTQTHDVLSKLYSYSVLLTTYLMGNSTKREITTTVKLHCRRLWASLC